MQKKSQTIDLTGKRFGRWSILARVSANKNYQSRWLCKCTCGRKVVVRADALRSGRSLKCINCRNRESPLKHGLAGTSLHNIWKDMIARCENPNNPAYKWYGGRRIKICLEWRNDFAVFAAWAMANGYEEGLTIDKIDNNKGYSPDNCQWLTRSENTSKAWHVDGVHGKKHLKAS